MPLVQDQINDLAGVDSPIEVKVFGPDFSKLRELAEQVGEIVEKVEGVEDMNANVLLEPVRRRDPARRPANGPGRPDRSWILSLSSTRAAALRPGGQHGLPSRTEMTKIRVRYPDRVRFDRERLIDPAADQPGDCDASRRDDEPRGDSRDGLRPARPAPATIRTVRSPNELWRENQQPVLTVLRRASKRGAWDPVNRELQEKLAEAQIPTRLSLGARRAAIGRSNKESFTSLMDRSDRVSSGSSFCCSASSSTA